VRLFSKQTGFDDFTDWSGTIAVGSVSQLVMPRNVDRCYFDVVNISTDVLWINYGQPAQAGVSGSIPIYPTGRVAMSGSYVVSAAIYILGATSGQAFTAKESSPSYGAIS
jgi:hypothetical protein